MVEKKSKRNFSFIWAGLLVLALVVLGISGFYYFSQDNVLLAPADSVTRSLNTSLIFTGETVLVSLNIVSVSSEVVATIVEDIPAGAVVSNSGSGTIGQDGKWRLVLEDANGIQNQVISYVLSFPTEGTYALSGTYMFGGDSSVRNIGSSSVGVNSCSPVAEVCDGLDNDCNKIVDDGEDALCSSQEAGFTCQGVTGCVCSSSIINDKIINGGNCNNVCDVSESGYLLDRQGNCDGICEESSEMLDSPDNSGNCDGCVNIGEIGNYKNNWLNGDTSISQSSVTQEINKWLTGQSSC